MGPCLAGRVDGPEVATALRRADTAMAMAAGEAAAAGEVSAAAAGCPRSESVPTSQEAPLLDGR